MLAKLLLCASQASVRDSTAWRRGFQTMRAIVVDGGTRAKLSNDRQLPKVRDDHLLVRPKAIALNPTDWKSIEYGRGIDSCIVGCDYAGIVEAVGSAVSKAWTPGDRVFGCSHGTNSANPDDGVFAEYVSVKGDVQMRLPDNMSFAQAATMPLGCITVGQGLYQKALGLQLPEAVSSDNSKPPVLIYGGGTSTAALAIQFAKLSGYTVITACKPASFAYVKSLGADHVFDHRNPNVGQLIRTTTNNALLYAWDTISNPASAQICADALSSTSSGLRYGSINPIKCPRDDVQSTATVMYTAFGEDFRFGKIDMPASKEDYDFGRIFWTVTEQLLSHGKLRPHRARVSDEGLEGAMRGLIELRDGKVKGEKLVYNIL